VRACLRVCVCVYVCVSARARACVRVCVGGFTSDLGDIVACTPDTRNAIGVVIEIVAKSVRPRRN
jgi:hypothetical protein